MQLLRKRFSIFVRKFEVVYKNIPQPFGCGVFENEIRSGQLSPGGFISP